MILSNELFVNAHRPYYTADGFSWSSGIKLDLPVDDKEMEECVVYSLMVLRSIKCDAVDNQFPLVC